MTLCYYVTGHGYGHAVRTCQILKALPLDKRVIVKTTVPPRLFAEELGARPVEVQYGEYDCGALQSDSLTTLPAETLMRYRAIAAHNEAGLADEIAFLRQENISCVVSDIPSFPLRVAQEAGVPGIAVGNFTWHDIYTEYVQSTADKALLQAMAAEYALATDMLLSPLSLPETGKVFSHVTPVPLIVRQGHNIREELGQNLACPVGTRLALLYLGTWGMALDWAKLARYQDWVFLTEVSPPVAVPNVRVLAQDRWRWADVAASVDAVVSKTGYGTITECIANTVPLIYVPRAGFAEQAALLTGMERWGGGIEIDPAVFAAGEWGAALDAVRTCHPDRTAFAVNGAAEVAAYLAQYL